MFTTNGDKNVPAGTSAVFPQADFMSKEILSDKNDPNASKFFGCKYFLAYCSSESSLYIYIYILN